MPDISRTIASKDEILLNEDHYLIETSKGELVYRTGSEKFWQQREQVEKVAAYWTKNHAVYVHVYRMVNGFMRWVGCWQGGKQLERNTMGF